MTHDRLNASQTGCPEIVDAYAAQKALEMWLKPYGLRENRVGDDPEDDAALRRGMSRSYLEGILSRATLAGHIETDPSTGRYIYQPLGEPGTPEAESE